MCHAQDQWRLKTSTDTHFPPMHTSGSAGVRLGVLCCVRDKDLDAFSEGGVCLFVCLFVEIKNPENYTPPPVGREVNPLGVVTHGQSHKPRRAYQRQRHDSPSPRTCQSMDNTHGMKSDIKKSNKKKVQKHVR